MDGLKKLSEEQKKEILSTAKERFKFAAEQMSENREKMIDDLRFVDGDQWPEDLRNAREKDGRPCLVMNRTETFTRQVENDIRKIRPSIKVRGVDSKSDPETASAMNGMIRSIEADSDAHSAYDWGQQHATEMGIGYWLVDTDYADDMSFDQIIQIDRIRNQLSVYLDPTAEQVDGSDAGWGFIAQMQDKDKLQEKYGDDIGEWSEHQMGSGGDDWYTEKQARVCRYWVKEETKVKINLMSDGQILEGEIGNPSAEDAELAASEGIELTTVVDSRDADRVSVKYYLMTSDHILEQTEWVGKYIPIVRCMGVERVIDGETKIKGMVRDLKDPARTYNYSRSAATEQVSLAPLSPWVGPTGSFQNQKWNSANKKNFAYLEYDIVSQGHVPSRLEPPNMSVGLANEASSSVDELKAVAGIFDPGLGNQSNEIAGVAINCRKKESDTSNFHYVDNFSKAVAYTGKILTDLIPKIYGPGRIVTILGIDGKEDRRELGKSVMDNQGKVSQLDFSVGRYDATVDVGPNFSTQREESSQQMMEFVQVMPQVAGLLGDLLAKNMDWPDAEEIADRLKLMLPPEILAGENPQVKALMKRFEAEKGQMSEFIKQLQQQQQALMTELQKEQEKRQVDVMKLQEQAKKDAGTLAETKRKNDMTHIENMTGLELEAGRDLSNTGLGY